MTSYFFSNTIVYFPRYESPLFRKSFKTPFTVASPACNLPEYKEMPVLLFVYRQLE